MAVYQDVPTTQLPGRQGRMPPGFDLLRLCLTASPPRQRLDRAESPAPGGRCACPGSAERMPIGPRVDGEARWVEDGGHPFAREVSMRALVKVRPVRAWSCRGARAGGGHQRRPHPGRARPGICGTDLHIEAWDAWAARTIEPPLVVGHEFVGQHRGRRLATSATSRPATSSAARATSSAAAAATAWPGGATSAPTASASGWAVTAPSPSTCPCP